MSRIRADKITNKGANGAPDFPNGITVTGVVTATTMSQNITGNLNVTGNIGVGGTLTYEDVTNVDSVGVITARNGIRIGAGKSIGSDGAAVVYYGDGSNLTGAGPSLANGSNDRVVTATGANALNGEANLTFANSGTDPILTLTNSGSPQLQLSTTGTSDNCAVNFGDSGDADAGKILYANTGDTMRFYTAGTERVRIESAGDVKIDDGNLVIGTAGHGISFAADASSATSLGSELLDDYEQGTWSPTMNSGGSSITTSNTYYCKVGNLVTITCNLESIGTQNGSTLQLSGIPFTPISGGNARGACAAHSINSGHSGWITADVRSSDIIAFIESDSNNANWADMTGTELDSGYLVFTITYITT